MSGDSNRFGKFRLLQRIGAGGMGEVHLAKLVGPSGFEKLVVIKRLLANRQHEKKYIDMFFREASTAAQLNHTNIVQIYEIDQHDSVHYIAMEYVQGKSLRALIDRCHEQNMQVPGAYIIQIVSELCAGLSFAHNARHLSGAPLGLIHRDINPHNVLISYHGLVKVIDFGIAKTEMSLDKTQAGTIKGTVVYMSPEQSAGVKLDKRSDQFAVGICLYEALTGRNPFHKATLGESLEAIRSANTPAIPDDLAMFAPIVSKALARLPDDRYPDCSALTDALQELITSGEVPRPTQPLAKFMTDLFADDIIEEERMLSQTELAPTPIPSITESQDEAIPSELSQPRSSAPGATTAPRSAFTMTAFITAMPWRAFWSTPGVRVAIGTLTLVAVSYMIFSKARVPSGGGPTAADTGTPSGEDGDSSGNGDRPHEQGAPNAVPQPMTPQPAPPQPTLQEPAQPAPAPAPAPYVVTKKGSRKKGSKRAAHEAAEPSVGSMQVFLDPPVRLTNNGAQEGRQFHLRTSSGTLQVGAAGDAFVIHVRYKIEDRSITYTVESEPWANVSGAGGITLGRTPLDSVGGAGTTVLEFANPKIGNSQRVTIRFNP